MPDHDLLPPMDAEAASLPESALARPGVRRLPASSRRLEAWVGAALFVLSGACGLGYEALWARRLSLVLGSTVLLQMTVLGAFMGGITIGSFLFARLAARAARPLRLYGLLEAGVGIYALLFPVLAAGAERLVGLHAPPVPLRIALAAALLLPPTVLMGGTFPALTAWYAARIGPGAAGANWLYAGNCAGAAAGVLVTGFVLLPTLGQRAANLTVAAVNLAVGLSGLALAGAWGAAARAGHEAPALDRTDGADRNAAAGEGWLLAGVCLSGGAAFIYELVWGRLFALTLGNSTYAFTLMLAAFISGLAIGSQAAARLAVVRARPAACFVAAEVAIALAVAFSIPLYQRLPYWAWQVRWMLRPVPETFGLYALCEYALTFAVMAVPTCLFGLTLPAAIRALCGPGRDTNAARAAGRVYGWNTLGAIVGVAACGALLLPLLGLQTTLAVGAAGNLAAALLPACGWRERDALSARPRAVVAVAGFVCVGLLIAAPRWHPLSLAQGTFRLQLAPPRTWADYMAAIESHRLVFAADDFGATVAVTHGQDADGSDTLRLVVDGKTDASSYGDMPTQILLGQVPLFLRPQSRNVFVVGLGSGVTPGSVLTHPVERVDCAELSQGVARALPLFDDANGRVRADPRFHLLVDDGRTALPAQPRTYDVIISEPPNPWVSGVGNLFSVDFYRQAAAKLTQDGLVAQWFHTYEFDDRLVATIVATFRSVFPHALLFNSGGRDFILVGSRRPIAPDFAAMRDRLRLPSVASDLDRIRIGSLPALLLRQTHGEAATAALGSGGATNSDDQPILEYEAPRAQYASAVTRAIQASDERPDGPDLLLTACARAHPFGQADLDSLLDSLADSRLRDPRLEQRLLAACIRRWPREPRYLLRMADSLGEEGQVERATVYLERAARLGSAPARDALRRLGDAGDGGGAGSGELSAGRAGISR